MVSQFDKTSILIQAILKVIEWFESLLNENSIQLDTSSIKSQRVFCQEECVSLSVASRHYLLTLEHYGVLTPLMRERIIHHAMLLDIKGIDLPLIEGMTHILLGQQPETNIALVQINKLMSRGNYSIH